MTDAVNAARPPARHGTTGRARPPASMSASRAVAIGRDIGEIICRWTKCRCAEVPEYRSAEVPKCRSAGSTIVAARSRPHARQRGEAHDQAAEGAVAHGVARDVPQRVLRGQFGGDRLVDALEIGGWPGKNA